MEPAAPQTFDWTWIAVSAPFAAAAVALAAGRFSERFAALLLLLAPLGDFYFFGVLLPPLSTGSVIFGSAAWLNAFGVEFTYAIDSLAVLFLLSLHFAVAAAMLAVAAGSTAGDSGRALAGLLLLVGAAQGVILADSFAALVLFMVIAAIASGWAGATGGRRGALALAAAPGAAAIILIATFAALAAATAAYDDGPVSSMTAAINAAFAFRETHVYGPLLAAVLVAALVWSMQLPLAAMSIAETAPASVRAMVFGVTALLPVYLLMRVHPFLGDTPAWSLAVPPAGALFLLAGCVLALRCRAPGAVLAWAAMASFGAIVMMVGTSLNRPVFAALAMVPAHGLCLTALLLLSGRVSSAAAGRIRLVAAALAALALAGAPLTVGYLAKGTLYDGLWEAAFPNILGETVPYAWLLQAYTLAVLVVLVAGNGLVLAALLKLFLWPRDQPGGTGTGGQAALLAPALLLAAAIALGLADAWVGRMLVDPARYAVNLLAFRVSPPALAGPALGLTAASLAVAALALWRRVRKVRTVGSLRRAT